MSMNTNLPFSQLDIAFSHFLGERTSLKGKQKKAFEHLCARLSYQQFQGHSCIVIDEAEQLCLRASQLLSEDGTSPLVIDNHRLYLQRYWFYENRLVLQIKFLLTQVHPVEAITPILNRYFIGTINETDEQKEAVKKVAGQSFSLITGGPGTGKTSTVVKILAILQELSDHPLHIALAAPTGKAAMRLQESISINKTRLPCSEVIKNNIPETVTTVHSLLGAQAFSSFFRHDAQTPLVYDLVVIDEASMLDLALMSKLADALKPGARLILLGDKDQLASVEPGAILADLTASLPKQTHVLKKSYRFQGDIRALADAINAQSVDEAWRLLENGGKTIGLLQADIIDTMIDGYHSYFQCIHEKAELTTIFSAFNHFQVLCSNRQGKRGVIAINDMLEQKLSRKNSILLFENWYVGRPVMVTENSPNFQLYNGDVGICLNDQETSKLTVFFLRADGHVKKVNPSRMPAHETAFAMTIHKSQGSEFTECVCVLADKMNPVLNKELLYTAITRAKEKLSLVCTQAIFCQAVQQNIIRSSGLFEKLTAKSSSVCNQ